MGKDCNGIDRGRCNKPGCNCLRFLYDKEKGVKCSNCGHVPAKHSAIREDLLVDVTSDVALVTETVDEVDSVVGIYEEVERDSTPKLVGNNVDSQGTMRGRCTTDGCACSGFVYVASRGRKCDECGHAPVKHIKVAVSVFSGRGPIATNNSDDEVEKDSAIVSKPSVFTISQVVDDRNSERLPSPLKSFPSISLSPSQPSVSSAKRRIPFPNHTTNSSGTVKSDSSPPSTSRSIPVLSRNKKRRSSEQNFSPAPIQATAYPPITPAVFPQRVAGRYIKIPQGLSFYQYLGVQQPTHSVPDTQSQQSNQPTIAMPPHSLPVQDTSASSGQGTCIYPGCSRPVYVEPNGTTHQFCGRTHAKMYNSNASRPPAVVPSHLKCSNPSCNRMKFQRENGQYFDYCGKKCRDSCRDSQTEGLLSQVQPVSPDNRCLLPGCGNSRYHDSQTGAIHDYCGKNHAQQARSRLIRKANRQEFQQIQAHFTQKWAHQKGTCGQLLEVLVIDNPRLQQQFQTYLSSLSVQTISQHYHGTSLKCTIYQTTSVCNDRKCGICGITQRGILLEYKTSNISFQRFGDGFYLAPNSSKCHDYTQGHGQYRAMLLFNVAEGRKHTVTNDNTTLKGPPAGYDSVHGQSGGSLNYDEIVVYKPEALLPTHILIYQKDGIHKIAK